MIQINLFLAIGYILAGGIGTVIFGYMGLPLLKKVRAGQFVREEGPKKHLEKTGTPTMGGCFFILSILCVSFFSKLFIGNTPKIWGFFLSTLLLYAGIGFIDDFRKVILKQNLGLTSLQKLFLQSIGVVILALIFYQNFNDTSINLYFYVIKLPLILYIPYVVFWFVGFSNATNITDGLDGLLATISAFAFTFFAIVAAASSDNFTSYFCLIVAGSMLGFLVFNWHPAKVFMGDTGSLALGALLSAISIAINQELLLLLIGIVYVIETASVMLQVSYFKYTKKRYGTGRRIFLMSPLHHHFEMKGYSEKQIVFMFSLLGILGGCISLLIYFFV